MRQGISIGVLLVVVPLLATAGIVETPLAGEVFQAYDGDALALRKIARIEVSARTGVSVELIKVNGKPVPPGTTVVDTLPGRPEFELRCTQGDKVTVETRTPAVDFPAGWLSKVRAAPATDGTCFYLWIVYEKLKR